MAIPKPRLTSFGLRLWSNCNAIAAFRELGERGGTLRDFSVHGNLQEVGAFEAIARGAPLLETVFIKLQREHEVNPGRDEGVADMVRTFYYVS